MTTSELSEEEIMMHVQRLLAGVHSVPTIPQTFDALHPLNQVNYVGLAGAEAGGGGIDEEDEEEEEGGRGEEGIALKMY